MHTENNIKDSSIRLNPNSGFAKSLSGEQKIQLLQVANLVKCYDIIDSKIQEQNEQPGTP